MFHYFHAPSLCTSNLFPCHCPSLGCDVLELVDYLFAKLVANLFASKVDFVIWSIFDSLGVSRPLSF
jgi:hypothetical protein